MSPEENVISLLDKNNKESKTISIIGDAMIDEYFPVKVTRLNPEFPTQCLLSEDKNSGISVCGGAANLCYQSTNFNCQSFLLSFVDDTSHKVFTERGVNLDYSVMLNNGHVPIKRRFYDGDFPLFRWDIEKNNYGESEIEILRKELFYKFKKLISSRKVDVVILSDYNKGVFSEEFSSNLIRICNEEKIITIVDPKCNNLNKWKDCTVFKPNAAYISDLYNKNNSKKELSEVKWFLESKFIKENINCQHVVVTDAGAGIFVSDVGEFLTFEKLSKKRPQIRSVIGAGDTFGLFLSLAMSHGFNIRDSSVIAYNASTVYVQDKHNNPITPYKLKRWVNPTEAKKVTLQELVTIRKQNPEYIWVMTNGCFDGGLHPGHLDSIKKARDLGHKLIVAVNTDESIKRLKGEGRPIFDLNHRCAILAGLEDVDFVVPFPEPDGEDTPYSLIEKINPDILVKGGDYQDKQIAGPGFNGKIVYLPLLEGYSTTNIIGKIRGN